MDAPNNSYEIRRMLAHRTDAVYIPGSTREITVSADGFAAFQRTMDNCQYVLGKTVGTKGRVVFYLGGRGEVFFNPQRGTISMTRDFRPGKSIALKLKSLQID